MRIPEAAGSITRRAGVSERFFILDRSPSPRLRLHNPYTMPAIAESAFTHAANIAKPVASAFPTFVIVMAALSAFLVAVAVAAVASVILRKLYRAVGSRVRAASADAEAQPLLAAAVIHEYGAVSYVSQGHAGAQSYGSKGRAEFVQTQAYLAD